MGLKLIIIDFIENCFFELQSNHYGIEIRFFSLFLLLYLWAHPSPHEGVCPQTETGEAEEGGPYLVNSCVPKKTFFESAFFQSGSFGEGYLPLVGTITQSPNGNECKVIRLQDFARVFSKTYSAESRKSRYGVLDAGLFGQKPTLQSL